MTKSYSMPRCSSAGVRFVVRETCEVQKTNLPKSDECRRSRTHAWDDLEKSGATTAPGGAGLLFCVQTSRAPWYAKVVAPCSAGYVFSPIQLIPSYIPVIGFLDDFLVLFVGARLLQRIIPSDVLTECRHLADAAEMRRKGEIRSAAAVASSVVIVAVGCLPQWAPVY